eukprot:895100-Amphidinium_carterae.1
MQKLDTTVTTLARSATWLHSVGIKTCKKGEYANAALDALVTEDCAPKFPQKRQVQITENNNIKQASF